MAYLSLSSWWEKIDLLFFCCFLSTCLFFLCCVFLHSGMGSAYLPMSLLFILIFPLKSSPMEFYTFFFLLSPFGSDYSQICFRLWVPQGWCLSSEQPVQNCRNTQGVHHCAWIWLLYSFLWRVSGLCVL